MRNDNGSRRNLERHGFSLLEVIIATAILVGSSAVLFRLISTGQLHQQKADRSVTAQIICQSLLDEILINPAQRVASENAPVVGYPDWRSTVVIASTEIPGLIRLHIEVYYSPAPADSIQGMNSVAIQSDPKSKPVFELVRWMPGNEESDVFAAGGQL